MGALGFVPTQTTPEPAVAPPATLRLRILASLAAPRGIWLRGQLFGVPPIGTARSLSWWAPWRGRETPVAPPPAHFETQIAGQRLQLDVPVSPLGQFDATF